MLVMDVGDEITYIDGKFVMLMTDVAFFKKRLFGHFE